MKRLREAVTWSRLKLEPFRTKRVEAIRQYVGKHYSDDGAEDRVPVNMIELAISIYVRQLAARAPRPMVTASRPDLRPQALSYEILLTQRIKEIDLESTLKNVVLDAMFSMGIVKCGLAPTGQMIEIDGFLHDPGQSYADHVLLDDWVHDMTAKRYEQVRYAGNRYRWPLEALKNMKSIPAAQRDALKADPMTANDESGGEKAETISRGDDEPVEVEDTVELLDLWLPQEKLVVTMQVEGDGDPIAVADWEGEEPGPYHRLSFAEVPGNVMPLPPVATWVDLHDLGNRIYRKLGRQAERQKTILGVSGAATEDGDRIVQANDGEAIRSDNPNAAKEFKFGGPEATSQAFWLSLKDQFAYYGGNLDALGGLGPQSKTLGQDELLAGNANQRISEMADRVVTFTAGIVRSLAWWEWHDPIRERDIYKPVPGTDVSVRSTWSPSKLQGGFNDHDIDIDAYSMQHQTPASKLQSMTRFFQEYLMPFAAQMQAQGISINFQELVAVVSRLGNLPELDGLLTFAGAPPQQAGMPGQPQPGDAGMPANTNRTYTRINRAGATRQGKEGVLAQLLMGANVQPAQGATLERSTG